jgi:phosphohistidine phosphatase SixA
VRATSCWADDDESLGRYGPVTALVSSAARTRETFERAFEGTAMIAEQVLDKSIYNGTREVSGEDLLHALIDIDPVTTSLLVVAHNPSVHELAIVLARTCPKALRFDNYRARRCLRAGVALTVRSLRHERYEIVDELHPRLERAQDRGVALAAAATQRHGRYVPPPRDAAP